MRMLGRPALILGAALLVSLASASPLSGPAAAATVGTLSFSPTTGSNITLITATSSAACTGGVNLQIKLTGPGFPAAGYAVSGNAAQASFPIDIATGGHIIQLQNHFQNFADNQTPPATLGGTYTLTMYCQNKFGTQQFGEYVGRINFSDATTFAALPPVANATATTTTLTAPTSAVAGTGVALTATVAPASAAGSVQFKDGSASLGSPVAVTGGTATITTSNLQVGNHSLTAVFTPTDPAAFAPSTSAATTVAVTAATSVATTTTLSAAPAATATAGATVALTATMSPATATGQVQFKYGSTSLGSSTVASGVATLSTSALPVGSHTLTAVFTPSTSAPYLTSTSSGLSYSVTAASTSASPSPTTSTSSSATASTSATPTASASATASSTPTPTATPTPNPFTVTDADGEPVSSTSGVTVGQKLKVVVTGFAAAETVAVTVHSTPHALPATKADATGVVTYAFTVPDDVTLGEHTLEFAAKSKTMAWQFTVVARAAVLGETLVSPSPTANALGTTSSSGLPATGTEIAVMSVLGLLLLTAGLFAVSYARRRGFFTFGTD